MAMQSVYLDSGSAGVIQIDAQTQIILGGTNVNEGLASETNGYPQGFTVSYAGAANENGVPYQVVRNGVVIQTGTVKGKGYIAIPAP